MKRYLILLFILASCSKPINIDKLNDEKLKDLIGKRITIVGKAANAKLDAMLKTEEDEFIWIDGMESWPDGYYFGEEKGKTLKVTGKVIERYDLPVVVVKDDDLITKWGISVPEGTDLKEASHRFLLKNIDWEIIKEEE